VRAPSSDSEASASLSGQGGNKVFVLALIACVATVGIHIRTLIRPYLYADDFGIVLKSWTWFDALRICKEITSRSRRGGKKTFGHFGKLFLRRS